MLRLMLGLGLLAAGIGDVPACASGKCCKHCSAGKACGDACIPQNHVCHRVGGCACNG